MQGLAQSIESNRGLIQSAIKDVSSDMAAISPTITGTDSSMLAASGGINITVNAAEGQSAEQIANKVMYKIQHATTQRKAVWG